MCGREAVFRLLWGHQRFIKYVNHNMEEWPNIHYVVPVSVHTIHQFIIWTSESERFTGVWDRRCSSKILCLIGGNRSEAAKTWHAGKKGLSRLGHEQSCLAVRGDCLLRQRRLTEGHAAEQNKLQFSDHAVQCGGTEGNCSDLRGWRSSSICGVRRIP